MIATVTLNPSVDVSYQLETLQLNRVNRTNAVSKSAGGKGLNVSRVLRHLDESVTATGFLGGDLGHFVADEIAQSGIDNHFISIAGETRNCIAILHDGNQTEVLETGPTIAQQEAIQFKAAFADIVKEAALITLSGSLPRGVPDNYYVELIEMANHLQTPVLLDTKGSLLKMVLSGEHRPYLIKPNQDELQDLTGIKAMDDEAIIAALKRPMFAHIPWVVVTLGIGGAIVKHRASIYRAVIPQVEAKNPVGSGDSVIAGFAAGLTRGKHDTDLIKFGLAMGVLNAMEDNTGSINQDWVEWCIDAVQVELLSK